MLSNHLKMDDIDRSIIQIVQDNPSLTHTQIAKKVSLSRPAVANKIRLLNLPDMVKRSLLEQKVSEGHARALLGLVSEEAMIAAYRKILSEDLSVRAVEELVRRLNVSRKKSKKVQAAPKDSKAATYEKELQKVLSPNVKVYRTKKGGRIIIPFSNDKELKKMVGLLTE